MQVRAPLPPATSVRPPRSTTHLEPWQRLHAIIGHSVGRDGKYRPKRRIDTRNRDDAIRRLRAEGASIRTIATELDWSVGTVHRVLIGRI
jgi:DNA-binding NarL/FixJ family response regulator